MRLWTGHPRIFEYINKARVVYLPDFSSDDALFARLAELERNDTLYTSMLDLPVFTVTGEPTTVWSQLAQDVRVFLHPEFEAST